MKQQTKSNKYIYTYIHIIIYIYIYHHDDTNGIEYTLWHFETCLHWKMLELVYADSIQLWIWQAAQNSHDELWNRNWLETDGDPCPTDVYVEMDEVDFDDVWWFYSSHHHGSWKWVPPRRSVSFTIGSFSISMIMGGRVSCELGLFCHLFFLMALILECHRLHYINILRIIRMMIYVVVHVYTAEMHPHIDEIFCTS